MTVPSAPWDRLYSDVKIQLPGVVDAVYQQELFRCVKDFCDQTNIWTETVPITALPNVVDYPFSLSGFGAPNRLMLLYDPSVVPLNAKRWVQGGVAMEVPGVLTLVYAPSEMATWAAVIAKTPTDPTDGQNYPQIDTDYQWFVDKYRDAFFFGTLSRLQAQPNKPYGDMARSKDNQWQYISQRSKARTDALKMNVYGGQRWAFPQSFATVSRQGGA